MLPRALWKNLPPLPKGSKDRTKVEEVTTAARQAAAVDLSPVLRQMTF